MTKYRNLIGTALLASFVIGCAGTATNGTTDGIVWAFENVVDLAVLHAYDATDLSKELWNSNMAANGRDHFGGGHKFITPIIVNGHVYVASRDHIAAFGLLNK